MFLILYSNGNYREKFDRSLIVYTYHFRYHPDTTPKGYRKDTEGISKGYESHTNLIVIT